MSLMDILTLIGGLALFLYGMHVMSAALEKSAGNKLKSILANMTSNTLKGFALGLGVTLVIQSSSATTVMVVGFVNSGIMTLKQAVGVIMGANLGTSITAWILSLSYIGGSGAEGVTGILDLFSTDTLVPIIALLAVVLIMFQKNAKRKDIGMIMMGFAVLMFGMDMMSGSVAGLKDNEQFKNILVLFSNPILGVIVGTVFTAIIQSSSASVGILQALTTTGAIPFATAIPIIMGQNIGTCVSAMISSVGASKNAKRAAVIHLSFNVIATLIILPIYYLLVTLIAPLGDFVENTTTNPLTIAIVHTLFKLVALCLLMPCSGLLVKLSTVVVKDGKNKGETQLLDERLMATPTVAVTRSKDVAVTMAKMSVDSIKTALGLLTNYNSKVADSVREDENKVDSYEDKLGSYLVKLSCEPMTEKDSNETSMLLHLIGDFERISDHAVSIAVSAEEISDKKLSFSPEAQKELQILSEAVCEILDLTYESFRTNDLTLATKVEPLEQVIDRLRDFMKRQHIDRLGRQECTIELGFIFSDLITCLERVSDHCSNIAGCILEMSHENMDIHSYLSKVKSGDTQEFNEYFEYFSTKYENQLSGTSAESVSSSPAQS
ncbi:MAG: Na/Pi cotransporter family protein [Clostridia bacterium]|nr:Na/Pi cotransporter family protein [Clostridia bacterium]MBQ8236059.1 Na/Pi cotransporter family protein [Clostridia bacterium]